MQAWTSVLSDGDVTGNLQINLIHEETVTAALERVPRSEQQRRRELVYLIMANSNEMLAKV